MSLTTRDRLFICGVGAVVVVACALFTLTRSADAKQGRATAYYTITTAHGPQSTAHCPSGSHVVGGGGHQSYGYTFRAIDMESYPTHTNGWRFGIKSDTYRWIDTKAFAICAHG
jgi:hypothetical protein